MKKALIAIALVLCMILVLCGCNKTPEETTTGTEESSTTAENTTATGTPEETTAPIETTGGTVNPEDCEHDYERTVVTPAGVKTEGEAKLVCTKCGDSKTEVLPATNSIKVLAIGNSFSVDAMEYLWDMLHEAGIEEIILGNLYIGGCSLDTHWGNMQKNANAYTYYENYYGSWTTTNSKSVLYALELEDWDVITIQQASHDSGRSETYSNLQNIVDYINEHKTNENAKIYWHMTWAYQANSTHNGFNNYGKNQMTMYNGIVGAVTDVVLKNESIVGVIPSGTTIQNLRTSYLGDTLTRDGYHMTYDNGRYATALTWFKVLTGLDIENINWVPSSYKGISDNLSAIREAVNAAVKTPLAVTESKDNKKSSSDYSEPTAADRALIEKAGYNPDDYLVLDWKPVLASYYNSSSNATTRQSSANSTANNLGYFISSDIFGKADLPNGTLIIVDAGYQYRPEGWTAMNQKTSSRPNNVTTNVVVVNDSWWGSYNYRAFNLSHVGSTTNMSSSDATHLHIYVSKVEYKEEVVTNSSDAELFTKAGLDINNYTEINWNPTMTSYYNSTGGSERYTPSSNKNTNYPYFISSSIFTKDELPNGTVIIVDAGYQYRPEGWVALGQKNASDARPANVSTNMVVVDSAWWGSFGYRAFNLSSANGSVVLTKDDAAHLRIYIPKK